MRFRYAHTKYEGFGQDRNDEASLPLYQCPPHPLTMEKLGMGPNIARGARARVRLWRE